MFKTHHPLYRLWKQMIRRCHCENDASFHHYGGRGIRVCDRWHESFDDFCSDMGTRPTAKHKLERLDNDLGYEPGNVIWATQREQTRNQRRTHWIEWKGKTQSMSDWADELGMSYYVIRRRLGMGWSVESAFSTPVVPGAKVAKTVSQGKMLTFNGKTQCVLHWSKELGISYGALKDRLGKLGWSVEKALSTIEPQKGGGSNKGVLLNKHGYWTPSVIAKLGTCKDSVIANELGITARAVANRRAAMGIASYRSALKQ